MIARDSVNGGYLCMEKPKTGGSPRPGRVEVVVVNKPWGYERIWASSDRYVGKILHINAGEELSLQYHNKKDETVHLLSGELVYLVKTGENFADVGLKPAE